MSCSNRFESSYPTMRSARSRTRRWHCSRAFHWIFWCIWMDGWNQVWVTIDFLSIKLDFEPFWGHWWVLAIYFSALKWLKCLGDQHGANKPARYHCKWCCGVYFAFHLTFQTDSTILEDHIDTKYDSWLWLIIGWVCLGTSSPETMVFAHEIWGDVL